MASEPCPGTRTKPALKRTPNDKRTEGAGEKDGPAYAAVNGEVCPMDRTIDESNTYLIVAYCGCLFTD